MVMFGTYGQLEVEACAGLELSRHLESQSFCLALQRLQVKSSTLARSGHMSCANTDIRLKSGGKKAKVV